MQIDNIKKLKSYEEIVADRIAEWERDSIALIASEIGDIGKMSKAEARRYDIDREAERVSMAILYSLVAAESKSGKDISKAYKQEVEEWQKEYKPLYEYRGVDDDAASDIGADIARNGADQTVTEILNLTNTKALCVVDSTGRTVSLQDEIYRSFGNAVGAVTRGNTDFYTAMRRSIQNLGGGGIRVDYGGGVTRRLDTVVRQNMLYGIKKANTEYSERVAKELNCDGWEIDAHNNSRDSHLFMQGKQYCIGEGRAINGTAFVGFDEPDPESPDGLSASQALNDYGCRHYRMPIICGVSKPRFTAEQLQKIQDDNAKEYEIDGKKGNRYFWSQKMRAIETEVRKAKDEINALRAYGHSDPQIKDLQARIRVLKGKYNEIADETGIDPAPKRLSVTK